MSDSDETVCEEGEGTMSPSIRTAISRKNSLDHLPVDTENGSPEFLPPNAKVQKLGNENTGVVPREPAKTCACDQDLQSLKLDTAFNAEKTAAERLKEIKKQEGKIEELLLAFNAQLKGEGASLKEGPIFAQAKLLMTQVKTQLAEFTVYQQQQRQQIAQYSNESQDIHDGSESQHTFDIKQKVLQLAAEQKELLACFQCHKKLRDKMQTLKKSTKANTKNTLPAIEKHVSSCSTSTSFNIAVSNPSGVRAHNTSMSTNKSRQDNKQSVNDSQPAPPTSTLKHAMLQNSSAPSMESSSASQTMLSDKRSQLQQAPLSCTSVAAETNYLSSETQSQSLLTPLSMPQQRAQNVVLTAGQFFQVGDKQVYVLPQGLLPSVTSAAMTQVTQPQRLIATTVQSTAKTQGNQLQQITPSKASLHKTSAAEAAKIAVTPANPLMTSVTKVQSSEGSSHSTLLLRGSSCKDQTTQSLHSQKSSGNALPITGTIPLTNTFDTSSPSTSRMSARSSPTLQQNKTVLQISQLSNHGNKQIICPANSTTFSPVTNENNRPPQMLGSARVQTPSHSCSRVQSTVQANKSITSFTSKATVVQSKSSRSLQRQNSFGSDLPDIKSLLSSNVIEAGSNVLSIQFEGRNFEASLRPNGLIESAGGETFRTPMAWMRAVTGSWTTVKQSQAYKMVHYKGKPLALFTIPPMEKEPCEPNESQNEGRAQDQQGKPSRHKKSGLITSWDDMAQLLTTCQVIPISGDEFIPTDSFLPVNFWDLSCEIDIPQCVLEELNF